MPFIAKYFALMLLDGEKVIGSKMKLSMDTRCTVRQLVLSFQQLASHNLLHEHHKLILLEHQWEELLE